MAKGLTRSVALSDLLYISFMSRNPIERCMHKAPKSVDTFQVSFQASIRQSNNTQGVVYNKHSVYNISPVERILALISSSFVSFRA